LYSKVVCNTENLIRSKDEALSEAACSQTGQMSVADSTVPMSTVILG